MAFTETTEPRLKVHISHEAWEKIRAMLDTFNFEFCFLIKATRPSGGHITINDIYVHPQHGWGAHTKMLQDALDAWQFDVMQKKVQGDMAELKGWGHSHVNMGVFESGDDKDTSGNSFGTESMGWCLSLVVNKRYEYCLKLYLFQPYRDIKMCEMVIDYPKWNGREEFITECLEKVKEPSRTSSWIVPDDGVPMGHSAKMPADFGRSQAAYAEATRSGTATFKVRHKEPDEQLSFEGSLFDEYDEIEKDIRRRMRHGITGIDSGESPNA